MSYEVVPISRGQTAYDIFQDALPLLNTNGVQYRISRNQSSPHPVRIVSRGVEGFYLAYPLPINGNGIYTITILNSGQYRIIQQNTIGWTDTNNGFAYAYYALQAQSSSDWEIPNYGYAEECISEITATDIIHEGVYVSFNPAYSPSYPGVHVSFNPVLTNPYAPGGGSEPGGGGGQFDNPTDPIGLPALPTHGVTDFIKLWNPSNADMVRLTELLFTGNIFTQAVRDLIGQPIDYIVSLGIVPVPLSIGGVSVPFTIAHQDAGFNMYGVAQQYMRWPCGSVQVPPYWNSFLDFEPHTSIQLYLPFIGFRDVLPSDVVGKTVSITYHLDVFTGACVAYVANEDTILYQYNGTCLSPIPFGAEQMQNLVSGFVGLLGSAATAGAVLTGGFGAGIAKSILAGSAIGAASSALSLPEHKTQHGGNAGSTVGLLSSRKPYFVLNRPRQAVATAQGTYSGYATWYTVESFGQLDGYTQIAECHLHDIPATDWELQEIERLLKEGVIF